MSRRPILERERPHLERLGVALATTRRACGLTQREVALGAALSRTHVDRLEAGRRRTRRSTLRRIAAVFVVEEPRLGSVDRVVADFLRFAGPALAEESEYAERVARRRALRTERAWQDEEQRQRLDLLHHLYELEWGRLSRYRPDGQLEEVRAELSGYFAQRMQDERRRRREIERKAG